MKPLCEPPFPIERIEELTACTAGDGRIRVTKERDFHLRKPRFSCYVRLYPATSLAGLALTASPEILAALPLQRLPDRILRPLRVKKAL